MTKAELLAKIKQPKAEQWHELDLSGQQITELPPKIGQLTALQSLDLGGNQFSRLPPEIGQLTALQSLDLGDNLFRTLPPEIWQLTALQSLDLGGNLFRTLPPEIWQLTALQSLDLRNNQFSTLPPEVGQLSNLLVLDVRGNPAAFSLKIAHLNCQKEGIYIAKHIPQLPEEILSKSFWEIVRYVKEIQVAKPLPLNEAKLILVGEGAVGKTCVVNRLIHDVYQVPEKTEGIDRHQWDDLIINSQKVRLNV
ncbi:MAG: hypothetical protein PHU06_04610 [Gallionella sp.]|nr:hypothetical protein [Gallionella sp.]MDD4957962.1 hypothetical protein [Gallionella sp.]